MTARSLGIMMAQSAVPLQVYRGEAADRGLDTDAPASLLRFLQGVSDICIRRRPGEVLIRSR
jgi:hypothetical protein